jgi:MFS transporter, OFA family, oxalate/formate antiporter
MNPRQGIYYGWIVVAAVFFITAISCGIFYSFGVFFVPVMTEFGWSRSITSGTNSVAGVAYAIIVPFVGLASDKYGYRTVTIATATMMGIGFILASTVQSVWQMYLYVGVLSGFGACAAIPLPLALVSRWFIKRQGLALGIASAGIGTGAALIPLLTAFLIAEYGWRTAFSALGLLILVTYIPLTYFVIRMPKLDYVLAYEGNGNPDNSDADADSDGDDLNLIQAIATKNFWLVFSIFALSILSLALAMTHVVPHAMDNGISAITAATLLTTLGFSSIFGRLTAGVISDRMGAKPVLFVGLTLQALMMVWISKADSLWMFFLFAAFFGVAYGGNLVMIPKLTASIFGSKSMGSVYSGISVGDGVGFTIGPVMAGYIFDVSGTYQLSFWLVAAGLLVGVLLTSQLKEQKAIG